MTSSASATSRPRKPRPEPPVLVSVDEASRLLSISPRSLYSACARGDILKVRVGRRVFVPRAEIDRIARGG